MDNNRKSPRAKYEVDIYYPHLNNKRESENHDPNTPVLKTTNISDSGISFLSRVSMQIGDFISFLIRIEENPSFQCLGEVRWVTPEGENFLVGCKFYTISEEQENVIRNYVNKSQKV